MGWAAESKVKRQGFAILFYLFFTQKLIYLNGLLNIIVFEKSCPALYKSESTESVGKKTSLQASGYVDLTLLYGLSSMPDA